MTKAVLPLLLVALSGTTSLAQSTAARSESGKNIAQTVTGAPAVAPVAPESKSGQSLPPIVNIFTVAGNKTLGLPCLNCLLDLLLPSIGLPTPVGTVYQGSSYQIDTYLIDNSYTGACTFTSALLDSQRNIIVATSQTLQETANTEILLSAPIAVPSSSATGVGTVVTQAVCGGSTTQSQSQVAVACVTNPPFCVD